MEKLVKQVPVYGMKLPDHFGLIGSVGLEEYRRCLQAARAEREGRAQGPIVRCAYARVGLMGNPSDGFYGKAISLAIRNYWAQATITPSEKLVRSLLTKAHLLFYSLRGSSLPVVTLIQPAKSHLHCK